MRLWAVALLSAGALSYEVLLIRLLAIAQWHHFAYMVISLALLGYGASGSFLALFSDRLRARAESAFAALAIAFALAAVAGVEVATRLPFNALAIFWEPLQLLWLALLYLVFAVPFFFAALAIGLALAAFPEPVGRIYRHDLLGAGAGAVAIILALFLLAPKAALVASAGLALLAALLVGGARGARRLRRIAMVALAVVAVLPAAFTPLPISPYKGLYQMLLRPEARVVRELSGPLAQLTVVESSVVPLRHAPGLSLMSPAVPPEQLALFGDGGELSAISRFDGRLEPLAYLDAGTQALPYHLLRRPRVLVLGLGGGAEVLRALYHHARRIDVVELDSNRLRLLRESGADFAGRLLERSEVAVHVAEPRAFVAHDRRQHDLIVVPPIAGGAAARGHGLGESYLHTEEAFAGYLDLLAPGGLIVVSGPLKLPPRDALKLVATARTVLARRAIARPDRRLALIRGWGTTTMLVKRGEFGAEDIARLKSFTDARGFDLAHYPGMRRSEANRVNRLSAPVLHDGAAALLGDAALADRFLATYPYNLTPARDDRPYAADFFAWRGLAEVWRISRAGGAVVLDWGHLIVVVTLAQAVLFSAALILLPLERKRELKAGLAGAGRLTLYFALIGAAFLLIEIATIQRFVLVLGHPLYAVAVVLATFLVAAGIGAGLAPRLDAWSLGRRFAALDGAVVSIAMMAGLHTALLPVLAVSLGALPPALELAAAVLAIAPLGLVMGLPFPLVLARVRRSKPAFLPWAWGVNGFASVVSAVGAQLLAMTLGFHWVMAMAVCCYALAAWAGRRIMSDAGGQD